MKYLSLVFDDGPSRLMCEMADKIAAYGWHAAFAVIGRKITEETLPMLQYVIDNGFQLVSHGQQHVHIEKLSSRAEMIEELARPIHTVEENLHLVEFICYIAYTEPSVFVHDIGNSVLTYYITSIFKNRMYFTCTIYLIIVNEYEEKLQGVFYGNQT